VFTIIKCIQELNGSTEELKLRIICTVHEFVSGNFCQTLLNLCNNYM